MTLRKVLLTFLFLSITAGSAYYAFIPYFNDESELETASQIQLPANAKKAGFNSFTHEYEVQKLETKGTVPTWLDGKLLLTGPTQFEVGSSHIKYWYNALSMLHAFSFNKGNISYKNAMLRGHNYNQTIKRGQFDPILCDNQKKPGFFSRLAKAFKDVEPYDNGNLGIWKLNNSFYALTETPQAALFDPSTLKVKGMIQFTDDMQGHLTTAQYQYDPKTKAWYNYMTLFGASSYYHVYKINEGSLQRKLITTIPVKSPAYMRTFGMTNNHIILIESPFIIQNPMDLVLSGKTFIDCLSWHPKNGTSFIVINKHSGEIVGTFKAPAFYLFNQLQAREEGNNIHLDLVTYENPQIVKQTQMSYLRTEHDRECEPSYLHRFTINLSNGKVHSTLLAPTIIETPVMNPEYIGKDYTFCYGVSSNAEGAFPNQLIKLNVKNGKVHSWHAHGCFPSRPIFIRKPKSSQESEGILASVVFDSTIGQSFLLLLDTHTFKEVARAQLSHHIPFGINGTYFGKDQLN